MLPRGYFLNINPWSLAEFSGMDNERCSRRADKMVAMTHEAHESHFLPAHLLKPKGVLLHFEIPGRRWHFTRGITYTTEHGTNAPSNWRDHGMVHIRASQVTAVSHSTIGKVMHDGRNQRLIFDGFYTLWHHGNGDLDQAIMAQWMRDSDL